MKKFLILSLMATFLFSCNGNAQKDSTKESSKSYEVTKSKEEWKAELTSQEYAVLREAATERPYSSDLLDIKEPGIFVCAACGNELYENEHKFESGTGWPSFDRAIEGGVAYGSDSKLGYQRDEVHCAKCGGHLGHVFNDGPRETTGKRHCINGVAMDFEPKK
ncbi:peptide-methionine (R)-S-oxide reductase MsrB [Christiangramia sp. OXR-203]|jgi:peptide-methionine (R)-S-oxide reductase|uniref:peptide-methionine (R)-S-oxide reductase MsrB n=1 Tax=Christiangramia sp. OXR-203 TaxID=3100176 RepID=UPI002AC8C80B|nr:peptide-methionine (R)-S-oxide reductase MsrB [Christiangramia sp. OXR-203]WPY99927.1 peptide-methionine (R)-S-oxide reductase MsrB [Christiangramia sp. OXR-203]